MKQFVVGVGDGGVSRDPEAVIMTFALGSCIAVMLHDPRANVMMTASGSRLTPPSPTPTTNCFISVRLACDKPPAARTAKGARSR